MADLSLKVKMDAEEASRQFKALAESSEYTADKIAKFTENFKSDSVDKFIDRQDLAAVAMRATGRETDAVKVQAAAYQREIERLIKSGLNPQDEALQKLQGQYSELTQKVNDNEAALKMQEAAVKAAKGALLGIGAIIAAGTAITVKAAAANEDMIASFVPMMNGDVGKATTLFKTIQKEAATTPFEIDRIAASVRTLMPAFAGSAEAAKDAFRMLGDTAQGNSQKLETITSAYTKSMLKGKVSMMEINQIANAGVPIYTELAKSMGVTEAKMMEMSKKGQITSTDLTNAFKSMTSEGGIFFNGMETASDTFNMRLLGIKENATILAGVIGEKLLPVARDIAGAVLDAVQSFTVWIQEGDNLKNMAETLIYVLSGLAAGFVAFIVVAKGSAIIHGLATAFRALTAAMAANPIGIIAVVITAVLIPALIALYKNWDVVQTYLQQGVARLQFAFKWLGSQIQEKLIIAFNAVKIAAATLIDFIHGNIIRAIGQMLNVMSELPAVGRMFEAASRQVMRLGDAIHDIAEQTKQDSRDAIQAAKDRQDEIEAELQAELNAADARAEARRDELQQKKNNIDEELKADAEMGQEQVKMLEDVEKNKTKTALELLRARLSDVALTENQSLNEQVAAVAQFLQQRADLEGVDGEQRIAFMQNLRDQLLADEANFAGNRAAIEKAADKEILDSKEALLKSEQEILEQRMSAVAQFFSGFGQLLTVAGEENRAFAIAGKVVASAEAGINTALAATKALSSAPPPWNFILMGGVIAAGLAQQIKIATTPIPSYETGGSFIVPDMSPRRVDGALFRANPDEVINITPRGMAGQNEGTQIFKLVFEGHELAYAINKLARRGDLYTLQLAGNL